MLRVATADPAVVHTSEGFTSDALDRLCWAFPAPTTSTDPRSGVICRHHLFEQRLQRELKRVVSVSGIVKPVIAHTLRHSFATHRHPYGAEAARAQRCERHDDLHARP